MNTDRRFQLIGPPEPGQHPASRTRRLREALLADRAVRLTDVHRGPLLRDRPAEPPVRINPRCRTRRPGRPVHTVVGSNTGGSSETGGSSHDDTARWADNRSPMNWV